MRRVEEPSGSVKCPFYTVLMTVFGLRIHDSLDHLPNPGFEQCSISSEVDRSGEVEEM